MSCKIVDTVHILELRNFGSYGFLNPVEIIIDSNKIIEMLSNYKKYKFRFIIESLIFSTNLKNNTDIIFIISDGLTEAKTTLINSKLYKTLSVVYLLETNNLDPIKNDPKREQAVFVDSEYHSKTSYFAFTTKNVSDLFNFTNTLLDRSGNKISFHSNETKVPTSRF